MADMPWDRFTPFNRPTDPDVAFRLWAAGGRHARKFWDVDDLDDHIQMGWDEGTDSPFISFSNDLEWAVYYTLKQEFVGDESRRLFQIQVPDDHLFEYDGDDETSAAFVESASEVFAHRFVDVYAYEALEICPRARGVAKAWFAERAEMSFPTYPFLEWSEHMRDVLDSGCE
ncbi:hypothetical protein BCR44DRAFT_1428729 [Catenaria anguillulae PL171]|uniref:Uncharacterized protein n=1 Tax=Catenaria anguillulae PL171 TaxID=765915 RepID=A0A1Y2HZT2_9FUNG|nr:hypothetical protein BCR44DRAFT_1428729 [Catenaria anguillulae PL171]